MPEEQSQLEIEESSGPVVTPVNLGKLSILAAVTGVTLKLVGDVIFEEQSLAATSIGIAAMLIVGGGISAGMYGLMRACKSFSIDMLLLAGAGIFLNGGLFAMGIVKLPMPKLFGLGPGSVSAQEMKVRSVSSWIATQDGTGGYPIDVNDKNFDEVVIHANVPVLVDFWSPKYRKMDPTIEQIAVKYGGKMKVCRLNIDDSRQAAASFDIKDVPTILFLKSGKVKLKWVGFTEEQSICSEIDKLL